ncbi:NTF2-domain-containing protein [Basidiobolus meristosporus CBS 931.73]|uniref:NTF2-domain-containing protein n=1 Tax=Basidiobolus meristosporus CBS 931.73 TaxID=1314790 RepID=A0A1Y1YNJ7_9FUNG|nr:NTF2-domain-containing protein [Basidiobolus meristosporus CBS 931.73]|eukprot:ORX99154.1 NTF2-domain-containing protein [Basidiobolus meristosporus CBS 931.73]
MTATTNNADTANPPQKIESYEVGWMFVQEYYTFLNKDPSRLHCFYNKKSTMIHGIEGEQVKPYHGQQEIHSKILELAFDDCRVLVSSVDSQASLNGGIMIQVLGEMSNKGGPSQKFAQTFFLAEQPNGYFVLNDIFRFLKEEIDEELDYETDIVEDPSKASQPPTTTAAAEAPPTEPTPIAEPVLDTKPTVAVEEPSAVEPAAAAVVEEKLEPQTDATDEPADNKAPKPTEANGTTEQSPTTPAEKASESAKPDITEKEQPAAAPSTEAKPAFKSWANLAANGRDKWGSQVADIRGTVSSVSGQKPQPNQPTTQQQPAQNQSPQQPQPSQPTPQPTAPSTQQQPAQPQRNVRQENSFNRSNGYKQDENLSVFVKGVHEGMTQEMFKASFSSVGTVKAVDVIVPKNCAFVEFTTSEAYKKAIAQNIFVVNGQNVYAEERRKNPRQSGRPNYNQGERRGGYHQNGERGGRRGRGGRPFNKAPVDKHIKQ